jgi:tripartite-type tricarboxylate transporter receptor subunit TctC
MAIMPPVARLGLSWGILVGVCSLQPAAAQTVEDFYKSKTVTLIISFGPGGLNDIAGRVVAQHLPRFIPGSPRIIVQNMTGAGGLVAANHLYNVAPQDGTVFGQLDRSVAQSGIRGLSNVKFDPLKFTWLGSLSNYGNEAYVMWVNSTHPARSIADLNRLPTPTRLGAVSGGTNMLMSLVAKEALGLNVQVIRGYPAAAPIWLAMERGEVDGQTTGLTSVMAEHPEKWERKEIRPLMQFGRATRLDVFANEPTARELAPTPEARALIEFAELPFLTSLPFVAPPNLPADRAEALQAAFGRMSRDEAFIEDAKKRRVELSPLGGKEILAVLVRSAATPKKVIDQFNTIIDPQN